MKSLKKTLAALLAVVMIMGMLPIAAMADGVSDRITIKYTLDSVSYTVSDYVDIGPTANTEYNAYLVTLPYGAELDLGSFSGPGAMQFYDKTAENLINGTREVVYFENDEFLDPANTLYTNYKTRALDILGETAMSKIPTENVKTAFFRVFGEVACLIAIQISTGSGDPATPTMKVGSVEAKPGQKVTVPVSMKNCPAFASLGAKLTYDTTAMTLTALNNVNVQNGTMNPATGIIGGAAGENYTIDGTMFNAEFQIKDDAALGEYAVGLDLDFISDVDENDLDVAVTAGTVKVVQVLDSELAVGYNVIMDTDKAVSAGAAAAVVVSVTGKGADAQKYTDFTMSFSYDPSALTFTNVTGMTDSDAADADKYDASAKDGVITVCKYGTEQVTGETAFTLNFTANATGTVTCTSAKFGTKASAWDQDEIAANRADADTVITVAVEIVNVTVPEGVTGAETTEKGKDYTFTITEPDDNYDYTVKAEVNGKAVTVNGPDAEGNCTIPGSAVTDDITITVTKTPKSYEVTVTPDDDTITLPDAQPTYGTDYEFTLNAEGYDYEVTVTVGGETVTVTVGEDGKYTIPGEKITGKVAISVTKTGAAPVSVSFVGTGASLVAGGASQSAEIGKDFSFTVTEDVEYYDYSVSAKDGSTPITLEEPVNNGDGTFTYTIPASAIKSGSAITVTVTETRNLHVQMLASEYVKLDGKIAVLYRATAKLKEGERLVYANMFNFFHTDEEAYKTDLVNAENGVWCFVAWRDASMSMAEIQNETKEWNIGVRTTNPEKYVINFSNDVNQTNAVDTSDAQMVWNMYNAMYEPDLSNFDSQKRFLEANTNHNDLVINVLDSRAIVASILN